MRRMTETGKWLHDRWFRSLPADLKLVYLYIVDNCDNVGVWEPDEDLVLYITKLPQAGNELPFEIGNGVLDRMWDALGRDRVMRTAKGSWWLLKFCDFQYGPLDPSMNSKPIQSYIKLLKKHGLWITYTKGMGRVHDTDKGKDMDMDKLLTPTAVEKLEYRTGKFRDKVVTVGNLEKYGMDMLVQFVEYWTEPNHSGTKLRHELQPTFDIERRLGTWKRRSKEYMRGKGRNDGDYLQT